MGIKLMFGNCSVRMHKSDWDTIQKIAREFGWLPEYDKPPKRGSWGAITWGLTDNSTRTLAKALYRVIHAVETDYLSEPLVELVREAEVGGLRDFADHLFLGTLHAEQEIELEE